MLIRGTCQKKDLLQNIHDAILAPGSNWTEISSNKTLTDYAQTGGAADGYVFKSVPIGSKQQPVYLSLKSQNFTWTQGSSNIVNLDNGYGTANGSNHMFMWLSENYIPNATPGVNGTHTNKCCFSPILISPWDAANFHSTTLMDFFVDIVDYRIIIIIQRNNLSPVTYPCVIYAGYPDPKTIIEGPNYIHQFILANNLVHWGNPIGACGAGYVRWLRDSYGSYSSWCTSNCAINATNPIPTGQYILTPITLWADGLGHNIPNTGMLGILDGIYGLPIGNFLNGDIIKVGNDSYQIFYTNQWNPNTSGAYGLSAVYYTYNCTGLGAFALKIS
jgi:hypothetical protein